MMEVGGCENIELTADGPVCLLLKRDCIHLIYYNQQYPWGNPVMGSNKGLRGFLINIACRFNNLQTMRNLSFFKLPYRRNFICLRKDSPLIPYGYLESHHLNSILEPLPLSTPIKGFLNSDFTQDEPFKQKQLFK